MNGDKYQPIIKQFETTGDADEKLNCLFTMVCMIATNHLHDIEDRQATINARIKKLFWFLGAVLLAVLFSDQLSMTALMGQILQLF